jgi:hypothetical protein
MPIDILILVDHRVCTRCLNPSTVIEQSKIDNIYSFGQSPFAKNLIPLLRISLDEIYSLLKWTQSDEANALTPISSIWLFEILSV